MCIRDRNSIDIYTCAGYMLRIDCNKAEDGIKTTPCSQCALNALAIDEPLEYAKLYLDGTMPVSYTHLNCIVPRKTLFWMVQCKHYKYKSYNQHYHTDNP